MRQRRKHPPPAAAAAGSHIDEGGEGGEAAKGSHANPPASVDAVPTPAPCATVRAISLPCPFIRPVQAAGTKRGREGDEADMSTTEDDDLEVIDKTPATKRRCGTKFRQI